MSGSVFGTIFRVSTWGESHGKAIGAVIDGCPAGLPLCEADIQPYLDRRKPGSGKYVTQRKEADEVQILSGIFDGKTTGTPISLLVYNTSQRSSDYTEIAQNYQQMLGYGKEFVQASKKSAASELAYNAVAGKYDRGMVSALDLQTAANNLLQARSERLRARLQYIIKTRLVEYYNGAPLIR